MKIIHLSIILTGCLLLTSQQVLAQADSNSVEPTGDDSVSAQETLEEAQQYNDFGLPTSAAPAAYAVGGEGGLAVGNNTQEAISHPPGVVGGAQGFYPSLTIGYRWWTNPQATQATDDVEDNSLLIQPVLLYRGSIKNRHPYELFYSGSYDQFDEFSNLDYDQSVVGASVKLDMTEKTILDLYATYAEGTDQRGASDTRLILNPLEDSDKSERGTLGGRFTLGRRSNPLQLVLGAQYGEIDYKNNGQQTRDRENNQLTAGVYWNITSKTSLILDGAWDDVNYKDSETAAGYDSDVTTVNLGVGWEPTYATAVLLKAGNQQKKFDNPAQEDYDGLTYLARVSWNPRYNTTIGLYASRRTEETTVRESSYLLSEVFGINLGYAFNSRFSIRGYFDYIDDEYEGARDDDIRGWGITASYNPTRWLSLGAGYQRTERTSTEEIAEYDTNNYSLTATIRRQPTGRLGDPQIQTSDDLRSSQ